MSLITVTNRLPFVLVRSADGRHRLEPGAGGLVTALLPVLRDRGGVWIGWSGTLENEVQDLEEVFSRATRDSGYGLLPIVLTREEKRNFYHGFSNEVLWPLFHDMPDRCNFEPSYWSSYQIVNRKFAETAARRAVPGDLVWVHDYHLMGVASELRALSAGCRSAFFLHIPFPPLDIFLKLPWRLQILGCLLDYDSIGFQTRRDRRNFVQCVRALMDDAEVRGKGPVVNVRLGSREVRVGTFPIGIDFHEFARNAADENVTAKMRSLRADEPNRQIALGVDRLDYSKGIPNRLVAFRKTLELFPEIRGRLTLFQVVVPSREDIREYADLRTRIEQLVGKINGEFTRSGWVPIHYIFRSLSRPKLLAYYRAADIALVTPLKDGMNLVAKEYCASNVTEEGVLILSEFAGAAVQLQRGALLVNPFDTEGVARAIERAYSMGPGERRLRMRRLRKSVRQHSIYWWLESFLRSAFLRDPGDLQRLEGSIPQPSRGSLREPATARPSREG